MGSLITFPFIKKEIEDELKVIENVIDLVDLENTVQSDPDVFLFGETNGVPTYSKPLMAEMEILSRDGYLFYNLESFINKNDSGVNNCLVDEKKGKYFNKIYRKINNSFSSLLDYSRVTRFANSIKNNFKTGANELENQELKIRHYKFIDVNVHGRLFAAVNKKNSLVLINMNEKIGDIFNTRMGIKNERLYDQENIINIQFHTIEKDTLLIATTNQILIFNIKSNLEVSLIHKIAHKFSNIISCKFSYDGEQCLILHDNGNAISLLDSQYKKISSQKLFNVNFLSIQWAKNNSYFILHSSSQVYIFNSQNFLFKQFTDFVGNINNIIISEDSNLIYVTTDDSTCPLYLIISLKDDFHQYKPYQSYENIPQHFTHLEFSVANKIMSFFYNENKQILKVQASRDDTRLIVMFRDSETKQNNIKIFDVIKGNKSQEIKMYLLCTMNNFKKMSISDFEVYFDFEKNEDCLMVMWNENFITKSYLNTQQYK